MRANWLEHREGVRTLAVAILLAGAAILTGCVRMQVLPTGAPGLRMPLSEPRPVANLDVPHSKDPSKIYRIGPRDVLRIDVRKDPTLTIATGYPVTEEGNILVPNIGPVQVANLTTREVEDKVNSILSQYIREPDVKVGVMQYLSKVIYVVGQVNRPGRQVMRADMLTLQEAIFDAGLPASEAAMQRTKVITPDPQHPVVRQIDLTDILYKGKMSENILLKPNDIVYVPARYSSNLSAVIAELTRPIDQVSGSIIRSSEATNDIKFGFGRDTGQNSNNNTSSSSILVP
jgi:polysaccharide biosynthesis/export protein